MFRLSLVYFVFQFTINFVILKVFIVLFDVEFVSLYKLEHQDNLKVYRSLIWNEHFSIVWPAERACGFHLVAEKLKGLQTGFMEEMGTGQ